MKRREMLAALAAGATLRPSDLAAMQGVILSELTKPVNLNELRQKYHAGDPVDLTKLRAARWSRERAAKYMERFGAVKGVNYSTRFGGVFQDFNERVMQELFGSGARPRIEFPLAKFNEQIITQELGWAQEVVGLNSIRVFLQGNLYQTDREFFFKCFEKLLEIADSKGINVMPVLGAMGLRHPDDPPPQGEPQFEYKPGVIFGGFRGGGGGGSRWDDKWPRMKPIMKDYIQTMLKRYAKEKRIILWDLHNEPATALRPLVEYEFQWAREVETTQPMSVCWNAHDLSDVITFHTYMRPGLSAPEAAPGRKRRWRRITLLAPERFRG